MNTMNRTVLLLVALTLCCCLAGLDAVALHRCRCLRTVSHRVPARVVKKIEVTPASGHCRRTEILILKKSGSTVCVDPDAKWFPELLNALQKTGCAKNGAKSCVHRRLLR
ncbi:C-X-C motif chemokine 10-like isoform X2 [Stegastes partitus]|uniref:C-X-C motif chemokine n=1 Tax=Stegastes partitus TaxID=144197 RepID=A0A3B4ZXY0_9TELE|nr:PREDICTED: C-X-C motif chemokine 10-like isoform X2 [Stegastes partitus]